MVDGALLGEIIPILCILSIIGNASGHKYSLRKIGWSITPLAILLVTVIITLYVPDGVLVRTKLPFLGLLAIMSIGYALSINVNILRKRKESVSTTARTLMIWTLFILIWEIAANKYPVVNIIYFPPPQ